MLQGRGAYLVEDAGQCLPWEGVQFHEFRVDKTIVGLSKLDTSVKCMDAKCKVHGYKQNVTLVHLITSVLTRNLVKYNELHITQYSLT